MRTIFFTPLFSVLLLLNACKTTGDSNYPVNHEPLASNAFIQLPLGSVLPGGWLKDQLIAQKDGLTGHLMDFWPDLMTSSWRGGDGEAWERGPYYLDGLAPLAYLLDDSELKEKVNVWIEYILSSIQENGWFGPEKNTDRWPRAVALKVLKQYYEGSGDEKAMELMKNYFSWLADNDPDWPDSEWRGDGSRRTGRRLCGSRRADSASDRSTRYQHRQQRCWAGPACHRRQRDLRRGHDYHRRGCSQRRLDDGHRQVHGGGHDGEYCCRGYAGRYRSIDLDRRRDRECRRVHQSTAGA